MRDKFRINIFRLVVAAVVLTVALACSQSSEEDSSPTPVDVIIAESPVATANLPSPTATLVIPDPTAEPADDHHSNPVLPVLAVSDILIDDCRISGDLNESGISGNGTAPAPTPTPAPTLSSRPESLVSQELERYWREQYSVVESLTSYDRAFRNGWYLASTQTEQSAQLHTYGNRLAQACSAVSGSEIPSEAFGNIFGLSESIRARHAWTLIAAEELEQNGDARSLLMDIGFENTSVAIDSAVTKLHAFLDLYAVTKPDNSSRNISIDRFGMSLTLPPTAVVVRNTIDFLVTFTDSTEFLDPTSLGPENWHNGTALRIRRLRNSSELSVAEAVADLGGIIGRYGEPSATSEFDISGFDELQFSVSSNDQLWGQTVTVFVHDGHSYIIELMCIDDGAEGCELGRKAAESLELAP